MSTIDGLIGRLRSRKPLLWLNPNFGNALPAIVPFAESISDAEQRLARCEGVMATLFPELSASAGRVESILQAAEPWRRVMEGPVPHLGEWFIKRDDSLPIAGSIKARGGAHEILELAESIATKHDLLGPDDSRLELASRPVRQLLEQHTVLVGSTGNLGLSIGIIGSSLGFKVKVHMSIDAKKWKKDRLLSRGVVVIQHEGDYTKAVAAGRDEALQDPRCYFVDDERSPMLFFGYAACARYLATQLMQAGRIVDEAHPLFVYIPCGVGGAPGGVTYGLKALYGEHVHCFFAEPVASPSMLLQLAVGHDRPISVYDIGLDNRTAADGLAAAQTSRLASPLMASLLSGVYTVTDEQLYMLLLGAYRTMGTELEPSAAAALAGPLWLSESAAGRDYVHRWHLNLARATHVIWTTGGSLVPPKEHAHFREHAELLETQGAYQLAGVIRDFGFTHP